MCICHHPVLGYRASSQMPCWGKHKFTTLSRSSYVKAGWKCQVWQVRTSLARAGAWSCLSLCIYSPTAGSPHMPRKQDSATTDHDSGKCQILQDPHVCSRDAPRSLLRIKPTCVSGAMRAVLANQLVLCWASRGRVAALQNSPQEASSDHSSHHGFRRNLEREEAFKVSGCTPYRMKTQLSWSGPQVSKRSKLAMWLQTRGNRVFQTDAIATRCRKPLCHFGALGLRC